MITMKNIILEGNSTLRKTAEEISFPISEELKILGQEMLEFLKNSQDADLAEEYQLRAGVGLAAPQLNVSKRMIAVHIPNVDDETSEPILSTVMINPKVISHSVQSACLSDGEGCLSVNRDVPGYVPRHTRITVTYFDLNGQEQKIRLKNYSAIVIQHEIDHINGIMFYDHINKEDPFHLDENISILS
ncbi:peptide deformylase [Carnobacterium iners]|uniref:Peptide deformylase n=1 Tax=Carnobacterium iners TaxID=1073423 RepID=A0A1X7NMD3_9LACT|nr:peptide deformylase [Carnobacterium iners]SEK70161.1 peptide deformylase [Carnobacterium iners]SMH38672.1 peptide deformylase [Carnobacterium iners]